MQTSILSCTHLIHTDHFSMKFVIKNKFPHPSKNRQINKTRKHQEKLDRHIDVMVDNSVSNIRYLNNTVYHYLWVKKCTIFKGKHWVTKEKNISKRY